MISENIIKDLSYKWLSSLGTPVYKTIDEVMYKGVEEGYTPEELSELVEFDNEEFIWSTININQIETAVFGTSTKHLLYNIRNIENQLDVKLTEDDIKVSIISAQKMNLPVYYIAQPY